MGARRRAATGLGVAAVLASACSLTVPLGATHRQATFTDPPLPVTRFVLPDGLQVIVEEDTRSGLVGMALVTEVGSTADPVGKEGLAFLAARVGLRTTLQQGYTITEALEFAGAAGHAAYAGRGLTTTTILAPRVALPALAAVAARLLDGAPFDPRELEVERRQLEAELDQPGEHSEDEVFGQWMREALYPPGHPSRRSTLGSQASLRAISAADIAAFRARHHRPERSTLVFTGGVSLPLLRAALRDSFAVPPAPVSRPSPANLAPVEPPPPPPERLLHRTAPIDGDELYLGWSLPSRFAEPQVHEHLEHVLSGALSELASRIKAVARVGVQLWRSPHDAYLEAHLDLRPGADPEAVMRELTARIDQGLAEHRPSDERRQWHRPSSHLATRSAAERASLRGRAAQSDDELTLRDGEAYMQSEADWAPALAYLASDRARGVHVTPGPLGGRLATEGLEAVFPGQRSDQVRFPPEAVEAVAQGLGTGSARVQRLPNGLTVAVLETRRFSTSTVALLLPGGTAQGRNPEVAWAAVRLGHTNRSLEDPGSAGALFERTLAVDGLAYVLQGDPHDLDAMLGWVGDRLDGTWKVDFGRLPGLRRRLRDGLAGQGRPLLLRARDTFLAALWRGHPYGQVAPDRWAALQELDEADLERWLEMSHAPDQAVVVVVGDVDPALALSLAQARLARLPRGPHFAWPPPSPLAPGRPRAFLTPAPAGAHVGLRWACPVSTPDPREDAVARLAARWLSSRLSGRLRRELALPAARVVAQRWWGGAAVLGIEAGAPASQLPALLDSVEALLAGAAVEPAGLLGAAWDELRIRNGRYELPGPLALDAAAVLRDGRSLATLDELPRTLASISVEEVRTLLHRCQQEEVYWLVGEPEATREAVRRSSLGAWLPLEEAPASGPR